MPFAFETQAPGPVIAIGSERRLRHSTGRDRGRRLTIGLVNNMPDGALEATERQFARLLVEASGEWDVRLILSTLDSVPRDVRVKPLIEERYRPAWRLPTLGPDALMVTGAREPNARSARGSLLERVRTARRLGGGGARLGRLLLSGGACRRAGLGQNRAPPGHRKLSGVFSSEIRAPHELLAGFEFPFHGAAFAAEYAQPRQSPRRRLRDPHRL